MESNDDLFGQHRFSPRLEDRLRAQSLATGAPLVRLRTIVVFDCLLARLTEAQPDAWYSNAAWLCNCDSGSRPGRRRIWTSFW